MNAVIFMLLTEISFVVLTETCDVTCNKGANNLLKSLNLNTF